MDVKAIRQTTGLSQSVFAKRYNLPLASVKNWEQGSRLPETGTQNYLLLIAAYPHIVAGVIRDAKNLK